MYCDFQSAFLFPCRRLCSNKTNVPADLQSAGNEYQDLFNPITSYLASSYTFNANIALNFSLFTFVIQRYFKRIMRSLYSIPADCKSAGTMAT